MVGKYLLSVSDLIVSVTRHISQSALKNCMTEPGGYANTASAKCTWLIPLML